MKIEGPRVLDRHPAKGNRRGQLEGDDAWSGWLREKDGAAGRDGERASARDDAARIDLAGLAELEEAVGNHGTGEGGSVSKHDGVTRQDRAAAPCQGVGGGGGSRRSSDTADQKQEQPS